MYELQRQTSPRDILVSDASFSVGWVVSYFDAKRAGRVCLFPRGSATLGWGLPAAIGASFAAPHDRVICVTGDGGLGYAIGELGTCRKYHRRVVVIVLNNSCLGYGRWDERLSEGHFENVDYDPTNFAMIAKGFGCHALRVEEPSHLGDAITEAFRTDGPVLIDVVVDQWATPELQLRKLSTKE